MAHAPPCRFPSSEWPNPGSGALKELLRSIWHERGIFHRRFHPDVGEAVVLPPWPPVLSVPSFELLDAAVQEASRPGCSRRPDGRSGRRLKRFWREKVAGGSSNGVSDSGKVRSALAFNQFHPGTSRGRVKAVDRYRLHAPFPLVDDRPTCWPVAPHRQPAPRGPHYPLLDQLSVHLVGKTVAEEKARAPGRSSDDDRTAQRPSRGAKTNRKGKTIEATTHASARGVLVSSSVRPDCAKLGHLLEYVSSWGISATRPLLQPHRHRIPKQNQLIVVPGATHARDSRRMRAFFFDHLAPA
ncbi:MAG: hypothetical protein M1823_005746 [Watsoniomyces obsoletus]|nr:MAG: hypothetical protein M1823_005746 [Watsoniomyces obsoletus]